MNSNLTPENIKLYLEPHLSLESLNVSAKFYFQVQMCRNMTFFLPPFWKLTSTEKKNDKNKTNKKKQPFVRSTHIDNYSFEWVFSLCAPLPQTQWMSEALIVMLWEKNTLKRLDNSD